MNITLIPQRSDARRLSVTRQGQALVINNERFDFSPLEEGQSLPAVLFEGGFIVSDVLLEGGELHLSLLVPLGPVANPESDFPSPVVNPPDGPVFLAGQDHEAVDDPEEFAIDWGQVQSREARAEAVRKERVPLVITMRQCRLVLLEDGLLDKVEPIIEGLDRAQREAAVIEWEFSAQVSRNHDLIALLQGQMGLSDRQVDDMFTRAAFL